MKKQLHPSTEFEKKQPSNLFKKLEKSLVKFSLVIE